MEATLVSDFYRLHVPLYIVLIVSFVFLYIAKNPLYWQLFISTYTVLLSIIFLVWYGPKDKKT